MSAAVRELRHAWRRLARSPAFLVAAALTLALGIGATTAVFTVVDTVLIRPLPFDRSDRLFDVGHDISLTNISHIDQATGTYLLYRRANHSFTDMGAYREDAVNLGAAGGAQRTAESERVNVASITASLLPVLRAKLLAGRNFTADEDRPGGAKVVMVSEQLWRRKYGADPSLVGRQIEVDGVMRDVVGIMPAGFRFPGARTDLWMPLAIDPSKADIGSYNYRAVGRLRDGITPATAAADLQSLVHRLPDEYPGPVTRSMIEQVKLRITVQPLRDRIVGDIGGVLWVVLATVGFVLVIACANVANLFLVRAEGRQKELAVRTALGASSRSIAAHFLAEGAVLASIGGVLGLALAVWGVRLLLAFGVGIDIPRISEVRVDTGVLAFAAGVSVFAALLFSVLPLLRRRGGSLTSVLKETGRSATAGRERHRMRNTLVIAQVALALVLLTGSGLMARSFANLRAVNPGFEANHVLTLRVSLPEAAYPKPAQAAQFYISAMNQIGAMPGVDAVGAITQVPLSEAGSDNSTLWIEDHPTPPGSVPPPFPNVRAGAGYFRAMGIPLLRGRDFSPPDPERGSREMVVSREFADRFWKNGEPLGKRVRYGFDSTWYTIVGVVENVHATGLDQPVQPTVYFPMISDEVGVAAVPRDMNIVVRTGGEPTTYATPIRSVIRTLDPSIPMFEVRSMREAMTRSASRTSFTLLLLAIASSVALVLGAVGIYGVISYMVSLRTREIGVRIALGASPVDVSRMVSRQGATLAGAGIVVGIIAAIGLTRFMRSLLFEVSPGDPLTLVAVSLALVIVALAASWIPARRAAAIDPANSLRAE